MDELRERAKGYIQMEEMFKFRNKVRQVGQKRDKWEGNTKTNLYKSNKRHKLDKRQPLSKGAKYDYYTPLTTNHTTILEGTFNLEVPIKLPPLRPSRIGLDATKYCMYHHGTGHNTKVCVTLKDKIEELISSPVRLEVRQPPSRSKTRRTPRGST